MDIRDETMLENYHQNAKEISEIQQEIHKALNQVAEKGNISRIRMIQAILGCIAEKHGDGLVEIGRQKHLYLIHNVLKGETLELLETLMNYTYELAIDYNIKYRNPN